MDKKYLSKLTFGSTTYDLKDAEARLDIIDIKASITGAMHYLGASTTAIADGDATGPWTIDGATYIASGTPAEGQVLLKAGDVATYGELEFIWGGASPKWHEYGSTGSLKALAFKDNATGTVACAGSNADSAVSFSGTTSETVLKAIDDAAVAPSFTEGAFDAGSLPSFTEGTFSQGTLPSFTEGTFSAGTLPSLGNATTGTFATEGVVASVNEANELLTLSTASTSSAVTAQGTFDAGSLPSKAADTWSAGTLPSKAADSFSAGTLPSKAADSFNAGSAATFTTESVITGLGTATAAAQTFTGSSVSVTVS